MLYYFLFFIFFPKYLELIQKKKKNSNQFKQHALTFLFTFFLPEQQTNST